MKKITKFEKEKLLQLLECNQEEFDVLTKKSATILEENKNIYDLLLKILQQGFNIREATLLGILLGEKLGYDKAQVEMEEAIKDKLYRAFKNSQ